MSFSVRPKPASLNKPNRGATTKKPLRSCFSIKSKTAIESYEFKKPERKQTVIETSDSNRSKWHSKNEPSVSTKQIVWPNRKGMRKRNIIMQTAFICRFAWLLFGSAGCRLLFVSTFFLLLYFQLCGRQSGISLLN